MLPAAAVAVWACTGPEHPATAQAAVNGGAGSWTVAPSASISLDHHLAVSLLAEALTRGHFLVLVVVVMVSGIADFRWRCTTTNDEQRSDNERRFEPF